VAKQNFDEFFRLAQLNNVRYSLMPNYRSFRDILENDPTAVGDRLRAIELKLARQGKLDQCWQPAPYPFEN
jgi:hypothetical protein